MKKIFFAIAIVLTLGLTANAQHRNDAFVTDWSASDYNRLGGSAFPAILSGQLGALEGDQPGAPLGSGLLVLTALGAGYAVARKKRK